MKKITILILLLSISTGSCAQLMKTSHWMYKFFSQTSGNQKKSSLGDIDVKKLVDNDSLSVEWGFYKEADSTWCLIGKHMMDTTYTGRRYTIKLVDYLDPLHYTDGEFRYRGVIVSTMAPRRSSIRTSDIEMRYPSGVDGDTVKCTIYWNFKIVELSMSNSLSGRYYLFYDPDIKSEMDYLFLEND